MLFGETVAVYCENHTEHTDTVCTLQKTHYVSAAGTNRLMLLVETAAVYRENHTGHINILLGQKRFFRMLKQLVNIVTTVLLRDYNLIYPNRHRDINDNFHMFLSITLCF
jgi:hypothetical protein